MSESVERTSGPPAAPRPESSAVGTRTFRCSTTSAGSEGSSSAGASSFRPPNIPSTACFAQASTVCPGGSCSVT